MSFQCIYRDDRSHSALHRDKVIRKLQRIAMLKAILETYEALELIDPNYLRQLRSRLRSAENQFAAMKPI